MPLSDRVGNGCTRPRTQSAARLETWVRRRQHSLQRKEVLMLIANELASAHHSLRTWLKTYAYEVWWTHGADREQGGFHERLHLDATPTGEPRRARLHPRQAFAYAHATELGWDGPARQAVEHGMHFFMSHYKSGDGFYRAKVAPDGAAIDGKFELYDQAFALLGFAAAYSSLSAERWRTEGYALHAGLQKQFRHAGGGFDESLPARLPLASNSHMHLLEAALAWLALDADPRWLSLATQIVELALTRWMSPLTGLISEHFDAAWQPLHTRGWSIEPGHQFEWAQLLLHFAAHSRDSRLIPAALRLIELAEARGVDPQRHVVMNSCFADGRREDPEARLWPQTERIKASCMAAETTGASIYVSHALDALQALMRYLETPVRGLWRDRLSVEDTFIDEPAPASSFYHIIGAALALERLAQVAVADSVEGGGTTSGLKTVRP
jgi:mannose/cellobiose epimerase-like protein (N-acyl-D-glucosamine 2-epimerase family)